MFALRILLDFLRLPASFVEPLNLIVAILFIAGPILGLFRASDATWRTREGYKLLVIGILVQVIFTLILRETPQGAIVRVFFSALAQSGLLLWCAGLGAVLAASLREKNLFLPVALFLIGFDVFLVFAPQAPTRKILEQRPEVFESIAMRVPSIQSTAEPLGQVAVTAFVGPADFFFLFMFFVAMHRFALRREATLRWTIIAMVAYLLTVLFFGNLKIAGLSLAALPAMVPIGGAFLAVNWREFKLNKEESIMTMIVAILALGLAAFGIRGALTQPAKPAEPLRTVPGQGAGAREGSPAPVAPGPPRS